MIERTKSVDQAEADGHWFAKKFQRINILSESFT